MIRVVYKGPPRGAAQLAAMLEGEGLSTDYRPPMERRGVGLERVFVEVGIIVGKGALAGLSGAGAKVAAEKAIATFKQRHADKEFTIDIEDDGDI